MNHPGHGAQGPLGREVLAGPREGNLIRQLCVAGPREPGPHGPVAATRVEGIRHTCAAEPDQSSWAQLQLAGCWEGLAQRTLSLVSPAALGTF